jgi:hypothetical protein
MTSVGKLVSTNAYPYRRNADDRAPLRSKRSVA